MMSVATRDSDEWLWWAPVRAPTYQLTLGMSAVRASRSAHVGTVAYEELAAAAAVLANAPNVFVATNGSRSFSCKQYFHLLG